MRNRDLDEEFDLEKLRDLESRRQAREQRDRMALLERLVLLSIGAASAVVLLVHHAQPMPINALALVAALALRRR